MEYTIYFKNAQAAGRKTNLAADTINLVLQDLAQASDFKIVRFAKTNFVEDVFPFSLLTKRLKFLQTLDCQVAEILPYNFTGGFNTLWRKSAG